MKFSIKFEISRLTLGIFWKDNRLVIMPLPMLMFVFSKPIKKAVPSAIETQWNWVLQICDEAVSNPMSKAEAATLKAQVVNAMADLEKLKSLQNRHNKLKAEQVGLVQRTVDKSNQIKSFQDMLVKSELQLMYAAELLVDSGFSSAIKTKQEMLQFLRNRGVEL